MGNSTDRTDELGARVSAAFEKMLLLGEASAGLRRMVDKVLEISNDAMLQERLLEELELAAHENQKLLGHLTQVHLANGERVDGTRPSDVEVNGVAAAAARALSQARGGLLDLLSELRALRRWSKYRFAWELKLIKRRFPQAPTGRKPPQSFVVAFAQLDTAMNRRRSAIIRLSKQEARWSIRLLRTQEKLVFGLWWKSSRRWIQYEARRHALDIVCAVLIGVFAVGAVTGGLAYLWGCAVSLVALGAQRYFVDPIIQRALAARHLAALADGAINWAHGRIFAAVATVNVDIAWRRVRDAEQSIPPDPPSGVAI